MQRALAPLSQRMVHIRQMPDARLRPPAQPAAMRTLARLAAVALRLLRRFAATLNQVLGIHRGFDAIHFYRSLLGKFHDQGW